MTQGLDVCLVSNRRMKCGGGEVVLLWWTFVAGNGDSWWCLCRNPLETRLTGKEELGVWVAMLGT